jgi:hypothetical protein
MAIEFRKVNFANQSQVHLSNQWIVVSLVAPQENLGNDRVVF